MKWGVCGTLAALATVWSMQARAKPYFDANIWATPIYDRTYCTSPGYHLIKTDDLQPTSVDPADTFLIVETDVARVYNDDCGSSTNASCVYTNSTDGCFHIMAFAVSQVSRGTMDVVVSANTIDDNVNFGGVLVSLSGIRPNVYSIHTIHGPHSNDATRTDLYLFDDQWNLLDYDDQSGAGQQATNYNETLYTDYIVLVASDSHSTEGYTDLAINDCVIDPDRAPSADACQDRGYDQDNDFLADSLEDDINLGTYKYEHDTDKDGLFDYYELIGRFQGGQVNYISQGFSSMGADPLRRDLFLEFDTGNITDADGDDIGDVSPPSEAEMEELEDVFFDLPQLVNPDGSHGITVHGDVGSPVCSDSELCGDWGGTDVGLPYDHNYAKNYTQIKNNNYFFEMRQGLFHYVYLLEYGSGQTSGVPGSSLWADGTSNTAGYVAHELGHNLGLSHYGAADAAKFNQKSAYPSLMNYNWSYRLPNTLTSRSRFSEGTMDPIDHLDLYEQSYSLGESKAYLRPDAFGNGLFRYEYDTSTDQIDFNYDGRYGVPGQASYLGVRYDISPINVPTFGASRPEYHHQREMPGIATYAGDVVVIPTGPGGSDESADVWAFSAVSTFFGPVVSYAVMSNTLGTATAWPSFDGSDLPVAGCDWSNQGEISAESFEMQAGERIVLVYGSDNGLCYLIFDPAAPPSSWPTSWSQVPGFPVGVSGVDNASVAVVNGELAVMFMDPTVSNLQVDNTYVATMDDSGGWTTQPTLISGIHTFLTPGLTEGSDGNVYMVTVEDDAFEDRDIFFWQKSATALGSGTGWTDLGFELSSALGSYPYGRGTQHLSLEFVPYLTELGEPFLDGTGYLAVFWNADKSPSTGADAEQWFAQRAYTTGYIGPSGSNLQEPEGWRRMAEWQRPKPDLSLGIDTRAGGVAMFVKGTANWKTVGTTGSDSWYVPYATGLSVLPDENEDHDDAATMDANMCRSVWLLAKGGNAACYCATANDPDQTCGPVPPAYDLEESCPPAE